MADQQLKIKIDAIDNSSRTLNNVKDQLKGISKETKNTTNSFFTLRKAIIAIATGASLRAVITQTAKFQDLQTILARVTGSLDKGTQALNYFINFAKDSTFTVEDLANAYILLANSGITPTERLLRVFTDTASASTDQIQTLNDLTKLFAKGVQGGLGLQGLTQLTAKGIPVFKILEEQLGLTKDGVAEFSNTTSGATKILDALLNGLEKSFSGATAGKADNLSTSISKLGKEFDLVLVAIGEEGLTKSVSDLTKALSTLRQEESALISFFGTITSSLIDATTGFIMFANKVSEAIKFTIQQEIDSVRKAFELLKKDFGSSKVSITTEKNEVSNANKITGKSTGLPTTQKEVEPILDFQKVLNNVIQSNQNKIISMNEQFNTTKGLTQTITENLNVGIKEFSQRVAESIVLGKKLSDTFRELAQSVLVKILQRLIEEQLTKIAILALDKIRLLIEKQRTAEIIKQNALLSQQQAKSGGGLFGSIARIGFNALVGGGSVPLDAPNLYNPIQGYAEGGSVRGGQPITVGERGREVFMPKTDGTIIPSEKIGGVNNINFTIQSADVRGIKELLIDNRATITNIVNQALNSRGKPSLV
jgi:hypothetical protein